MARLVDSPLKIKRILIPVESTNSQGLRPVRFAQSLAVTEGIEITLLHVCSLGTSKERKDNLHQQLEKFATRFFSGTTVDIKVIPQNNFVRAILNASRSQELVILRSQRQRVGADGLALSPTTRPLLQNLNCSVIVLGEP